MQVYIWKRAEHATWREHSEAGVVIIAASLLIARAMFRMWQREHNCTHEQCSVFLVEPDEDLPTIPRTGAVFVFPDAGCC